MRAVSLVYLPNSNFLIGTFDPLHTTGWWISSGFDNVEYVKKGMQIMGSIHLAICKELDGTWSIFRSEDYAQTWVRVLNISYEIYDIVEILPGRAIINTGNGFYETVTSGATWTLVLGLPSSPIAAAIANVGNGDILICSDGRYIWRSTNLARSWVQVCDQRSLGGRKLYKDQDNKVDMGFSWTYGSPLTPAVAGANGEVLCAYGPWISMSHDYGRTWNEYARTYYGGWLIYNTWDGYASLDGCSKGSDIYSSLPSSANSPSSFQVKQILVSGVHGPLPSDVDYVVRIDGSNYSKVLYGHHGTYSTYHGTGVDISPSFWIRYTSPLVSDGTNQISAYEATSSFNSDIIDKILVSVTYKFVDGVLVPSLIKSTDYGLTWKKVDLQLVEFELSSDKSIAITDETFASSTWVSIYCDNIRYPMLLSEYWRRLQSYDIDFMFQPFETMSETYDMLTKIEPPYKGEVEYEMGLYALGRHEVEMLHDSLIEVTNLKSYLNAVIIENHYTMLYQVDEITEIDRLVSYEMAIWLERRVYKPYVMSYFTEIPGASSYSMGAFFVHVTVPDIDWASPQWWNILFPDTTKAPLNSRGGY